MDKQFKLLLLGCGDIATRLANKLDMSDYDITGLRRQPGVIEQFPVLSGDAGNLDDVGPLMHAGFDAVVVTMTPSERSEEGYRNGYYRTMETLSQGITASGSQPLVIFVSSTSVYGQNHGEWIDEQSVTEPAGFAGNVLLATERRLQSSGVAHCIVRFSGIYGPGRISQLKAVVTSKPLTRPLGWTNRIHSDDCAGVLAYLLEKYRAGSALQPVYLASDNVPIMQWRLREALSDMLGVDSGQVDTAVGDAESGKRCCNQLLKASGYQFLHGDYTSGYRQLVEIYRGGE